MRVDRSRRTVAIGVVVLAVAAAWVADRELSSSSPATPTVPASAVLAGAGASSSAWYCSATAEAPEGTAATVLVTNAGNRAVTVAIETFPVAKPGAAAVGMPSGSQPMAVPAGSQVAAPVAGGATEVLVHGGAVGVAEELSGPAGWSDAPCASSTSPDWYFPQGKTTAGNGLQLAMFNPTPTAAVVDVSFVTTSGATVQPPAYQGLSVEPGTVLVENIGDHIPDATFASEVSAPTGTVVADEVDEGNALGQGWVSIMSGIDAPEATWAFPESAVVPQGTNDFTIFDPADGSATVTVSFALNEGKATPLVLHVPGHATTTLAAEAQTRIPAGSIFGLRFTSSGPGVVVSRNAYAPGAAPANTGLTQGLPGGLRRWLVPPAPPGRIPLHLALLNLGPKTIEVRVTGFGAAGERLPAQAPVAVPPGGAVVVVPSPTMPVGLMPTEVTADGPLVAELEPAPSGAPGVSVIPAWPLLDPTG